MPVRHMLDAFEDALAGNDPADEELAVEDFVDIRYNREEGDLTLKVGIADALTFFWPELIRLARRVGFSVVRRVMGGVESVTDKDEDAE